MQVPETCSPDRRCTPALGMVQTTKAAQQREGGKILTRVDLFSGEGQWVIYIGKPNRPLIRISKSRRLGIQVSLGFYISQT